MTDFVATLEAVDLVVIGLVTIDSMALNLMALDFATAGVIVTLETVDFIKVVAIDFVEADTCFVVVALTSVTIADRLISVQRATLAGV